MRVCSAVDLHVFACFRSAGAAHRGGVGGGEAEDQWAASGWSSDCRA